MLAILTVPLWFVLMIWAFQAIDWLQRKAKISDADLNAAALVLLLTGRHR